MYTVQVVTVLCVILPAILAADKPAVLSGPNAPTVLAEISGTEYYYRTVKEDYDTALQACSQYQMNLLSIKSDAINRQIADAIIKKGLTPYDFWTSGSRRLDGKSWLWQPSGDNFSYKQWSQGRPTEPGTSQDCVEVRVNGNNLQWYDERCLNQYYSICEKTS